MACLAVVILSGAAASADFIAEDNGLGHGHGHSHGAPQGAERTDLRVIERVIDSFNVAGQRVARVFLRFSSYSPIPRVADGRYVGWSEVGSCFGWIGGLWTSSVLLLGVDDVDGINI